MSTDTAEAFISKACNLVREAELIRPRGSGTKPPLIGSAENLEFLDMSSLSGITEYDPSEYTFTAYAGTKLADLQRVLGEQGQGLPFDPPLVEAGATVGGTVAAGLSGPCRVTHGGVRDFILGIKFIDGKGNLIRSGGKVVKNAAGFDLPKFFVGSAGRFGILVEVTFKVFPMPSEHLTLSHSFEDLQSAIGTMQRISLAPLQIEALDLLPPCKNGSTGSETSPYTLRTRLGGSQTVLDSHASRIDKMINNVGERTNGSEDARIWSEAREFRWRASNKILVKVPITPKYIVALEDQFDKACIRRRYSVAGNVAWLSVASDEIEMVDRTLKQHVLAGLTIQGNAPRCLWGVESSKTFVSRVKRALDPLNKFGELL